MRYLFFLLLTCYTVTMHAERIVIVTGGSKGIGKGIAKVFVEKGDHVVLVARHRELLEATAAEIGNATPIVADMGKEEEIQSVVDQTIAKFGRIDVVCHNAGIYPEARLDTMTLEEWQHVINVNLTSTFLIVNKTLPHMKKQGEGKFVITSSISGPVTALPGFAHYTASKGGVAGFVKTAGVELAKYNVQVNAVEPGNIMTEGLQDVGEEYLANNVRAIPAGRFGLPEEIGYAAYFLASHEADFITGQSLVVDGGQTLPESHFCEF